MTIADFWSLMAGLGIFLYGMFHLEDSIKQLEGRGFKLFLRKHTKNKLSAILSGTFITGILQSSSVVNLIILSFVGAGLLSMRNALGVVLGSNIGGTFNSWLVALLGFKVDIKQFTLPIIALAGIGLVLFRNKKSFYQLSKFCMGFGLLFLGLDFMKSSMESLVKDFNFTPFLNYPPVVFVLVGFVITALIQTSAATVVIVLSALYAKIIPIETAVAIVIGSELGTTIKIWIASAGGIIAKKRLAIGNIIFNVITTILGVALLIPILNLLTGVIGFNDPLIVLVAFQTLINIISVILFYYFLNYFGEFLEKYFPDKQKLGTFYLQNINAEDAETAIEMMGREVGLFILRVITTNMEVFQIEYAGKANTIIQSEKNKLLSDNLSYSEKYKLLKETEGQIFSYYTKIVEANSGNMNLNRLNQLMSSVRNAMYSAKGMKDIDHDRREFSNSGNDLKYNIYTLFRSQLNSFYAELNRVYLLENKKECFNGLSKLIEEIKADYEARVTSSYKQAGNGLLKEVDVSTLFNINRELYSSCKAIIFSLKDFKLEESEAIRFENIPESGIR